MRVFLIKYKGALTFQNMTGKNILYSYDNGLRVGLLFFRKKDAKKFLKTLSNKQSYEIISATIDKSKTNNRKSS